MIEAALIALLAVAAIVYVAAPLRRPRGPSDASGSALEEADARRRTALGGLVDIEGERAVGKLSEEDFEALRAEYERDALAALRELDALGAEPADDDLEREIAELRARLTCPACGAVKSPGEKCERCGEE